MAIFRGKNNKKAYETQPSELIKKNEKTGEVQFAYDSFILGGSNPEAITLTDGDVVLLQELPANAKVLRVTLKTSAAMGIGEFDIGHSGSAPLGDKDNKVLPDHDAFVDGFVTTTLLNATMPLTAVGYLQEYAKPVFVVINAVDAPATQSGQLVEVIVEYVSK